MLPLFLILVCSQFFASFQARGEQQDVALKVRESCSEFEAQVRSLDDLKEFHGNFEQIAKKKRNSTGGEDAEFVCFKHQILFKTVDRLNDLAKRLDADNEYVCTIEYAGRIYRLHRTLQATLQHTKKHHLMNILDMLVSKWMNRCTSSLGHRLMEVEKRAPDSVRHLNFILGIMRFQVDPKLTRQLELPLDSFVPVLESEMLDESELPTDEGYQFEITKTQKLVFESSLLSCRSLKLYFVNILGSLGLVGSLGYEASVVDYATRLSARERQQDWLLGSLVCQSLVAVSRVSITSKDDRNTKGIMVRTLRKPNVKTEDERDTTFAGFRLREKVSQTETTPVARPQKVANMGRLRKLQLIEGPTKLFADAIMQYLDMNHAEREKLPYNLLGLEPPAKPMEGLDEENHVVDDNYNKD